MPDRVGRAMFEIFDDGVESVEVRVPVEVVNGGNVRRLMVDLEWAVLCWGVDAVATALVADAGRVKRMREEC